jgi:two-component system cell cycle sensor histidine kinase PleC
LRIKHQVGISLSAVAVLAAEELADTGPSPELLEALDALRVAITLFDSHERLTWCNQHFNYLFRSMPPREELQGLTYAELIRLEVTGGEIAPLDGDVESFVARRRTQLREGEYAPRDIHLADGRIVEIKARRTKTGNWIALWNDVTQARHTFMRLEDLVELSADAFAFWDRNDRLLLCNAAYTDIHGHPGVEFVQHAPFEEMIRSAVQRERFIIDGDPNAWIERRLDAHRSPAGALTVVVPSGDAYLVRDRATRDGGRATVFTDVTERHRAEAALSEQTEALERTKRALAKSQVQAQRQQTYLADLTRRLDEAAAEADTAKTALLRTMSHELKTPLNAIIGFADLLQLVPEQFSKEQVTEYAGLIHGAGKNLLKLINQILDLTKLAARRFPLNPATVSVGGAIWMALDTVRTKAEQKSISLDVVCEPELIITADENALGNMIAQLVDNAVNFTHPGGDVRVSAAREGARVRIAVADNGPGVAPEDMQRILEPFEQAARGTHDHTQGAGLGLPLAKALAELHGGSLSIASTVGDGFTATVELPVS